MSDQSETAGRSSLGATSLPSAELIWQALENRSALAGLELRESRDEAVRLSVAAIMLLLGLQLTGVALLAVVAAVSWDTEYRVVAISGAAGLLACLTIGSLCWLRTRLAAWSPFSSLAGQLAKDCDLFRTILRDRESNTSSNEKEGSA